MGWFPAATRACTEPLLACPVHVCSDHVNQLLAQLAVHGLSAYQKACIVTAADLGGEVALLAFETIRLAHGDLPIVVAGLGWLCGSRHRGNRLFVDDRPKISRVPNEVIAPAPESAVVVDGRAPALGRRRLDLAIPDHTLDLDDEELPVDQLHDEVRQVIVTSTVLAVPHDEAQVVVLHPARDSQVCVQSGRRLLPRLGIVHGGVEVALLDRVELAPGVELDLAG